jgi:hypothetical protein
VHGKDTKFGIVFMDNSKSIVNQVSYSFKITTIPDSKVIKDLQDQKAPESGAFNVKVSVDGAGGLPTGEFIESSTFNLVAA